MKKLILIVAAAFIFISTGFSQNHAGKNDPNAKLILDAVSSKFKTFTGVQSGFTLQVEDGKGKVQGVKKGPF